MRPLRIGQASDLHFCPKNLAESDRCFGAAVDAAIAADVDAFVIAGDSTDHALDLHNPAVRVLAAHIRRLSDHCPVLMLQGTFSHEPPGTLGIFPLVGGRYGVQVVERICQVALDSNGRWHESSTWGFAALPKDTIALFSCLPTLNKGALAAAIGGENVAEQLGEHVASVLKGFGPMNKSAAQAGIATIGVSHGTVYGCNTEHGVPMAGLDHEFTSGSLFAANASAFMVGHIHAFQSWEQQGQVIAYAGSIGRFHHGEKGEKGWILWEVDAACAAFEFKTTPSRRTVDLRFDGIPDVAEIEKVVASGRLDGIHVRVSWDVPESQAHAVDRDAIERALGRAASVQLEGHVLTDVVARSPGISKAGSLEAQVRAWAALANQPADCVMAHIESLQTKSPQEIVAALLAEVGLTDGGSAAQARAGAGATDHATSDDSAQTLALF